MFAYYITREVLPTLALFVLAFCCLFLITFSALSVWEGGKRVLMLYRSLTNRACAAPVRIMSLEKKLAFKGEK